LSEFIRRSMEAQIAGRTTKAIAAAVAHELLPEIERMLANGTPPASVVTAMVPPKAFDRGCFDADLHQVGRVCRACSGSF